MDFNDFLPDRIFRRHIFHTRAILFCPILIRRMFEFRSLFIIYFLFAALTTIYIYNIYINWPVIRSPIFVENFVMELPDQDLKDDYMPGEPVRSFGQSYLLLNKDSGVVESADKVGSEACYRSSYQACVNSVGGSHLQMTNNYKRINPDSCSANPLLGHFYNDA